MPPSVQVANVAKCYKIRAGSGNQGYQTLRETLAGAVRSPLRRYRQARQAEEFWALEDVGFEIHPGEVVGILGRNGSGKSTLLKILSRITKPTRGRAELHGRVGSLLEVGTGFHPELTGRENVYLNGSILGMRRSEIAQRFDRIAAFAEVERFLDTPVKRYSSGMYVRLAFAVASHLEPEILLIDEVLAVGDAAYQERCTQKMAELAASGLTILLVSHNMDLIPRLCSRAILLHDGKVTEDGSADHVLECHLRNQLAHSRHGSLEAIHRSHDPIASFASIRMLDPAENSTTVHISGNDLVFEIEVKSTESIADAELSVAVLSRSGTRIMSSWTRELGHLVHIRPGRQTYVCRLENARLRPGHTFHVWLWLGSNLGDIDWVEQAMTFSVLADPDQRSLITSQHQGAVLCHAEWTGDLVIA